MQGILKLSSYPELLDKFDGDPVFLLDVAESFILRSSELQDQLWHAVEAQAPYEAERSAHTLRGLIAYFERGPAFASAEAIEVRAQQRNIAAVSDLLPVLDFFVNRLRTHLESEVFGDVTA